MANDKNFKIKNGLSVGTRYLQTGGADGAGTGPAYDLTSILYDDVSFSVATQDTNPSGVVFNPDGTKMYIAGRNTGVLYQYALSTAFDLSTASYDSISFNPAAQASDAVKFKFNTTGTKMYVLDRSSSSVYEYTLSTAFNLSTATYNSVNLSVSGQDTNVFALSFNSDGTKMYVGGLSSVSIHEYTLSTAFDLSTASYGSVSFSVAAQDASGPVSVNFNSDGTKMYMIGFSSEAMYQYSLSTAYDLSTASYDSISFSFTEQAQEAAFNSSGSKMYVVASSADAVLQYSTQALTQTLDLSTGSYFSFTPSGATTVSFTNAPASGKAVGFAVEINGDGSAITWPTSVKWPSGVAPTATASKEVYAFVTTDGGTTYYGKKAGSDIA